MKVSDFNAVKDLHVRRDSLHHMANHLRRTSPRVEVEGHRFDDLTMETLRAVKEAILAQYAVELDAVNSGLRALGVDVDANPPELVRRRRRHLS